MKNRKALQYSVAFMLLVLSPVAGSAGQKPGPPGPPPEAISACTDKNEGDTVTFVDRHGESVTATCMTLQGKLVAMPEGHHERKKGPGGPPPEAVNACKDKTDGDKVTFVDRHGESVAATCTAFNGMLVAAPEGQHMGMPCPDNPPLEAVSACKAKQEGDKVTFAGPGDESFSGICKTVKGVLVAVPEEPIAK